MHAISIMCQCHMQAQLAMGAMGLPILCEVVREERDDLEMLRGALECLCLAVPAASGGNPQRPQARHLLNLSCCVEAGQSCEDI